MTDVLTELQAARSELHKSTYWPSASKQKGANHLWQTDVHIGNAIGLQTIPLPPPARRTIGFATGAGPDTYTGMDAASRAKYLDAIVSCGGNVIRFDCVGDAREIGLMQEAHDRGLEVIPIVMQFVDPIAYAARARAVATISKPFGFHRYELGNEPNLPTGGLTIASFGGIPGYVRSANAGYDAIKLVDTAAVVGSAGLAAYGVYGETSADGNSIDYRLFYQQLVAAGLKHDAVCAHPYGYWAGDKTLADLTSMTDLWRGWGALLTLPHSIKATANGKPIWVTEVGIPSTGHGWTGGFSEQLQADYAAWCVAKIRSEPAIELGCLYSTMDYKGRAGDDQGHFGTLLRADWSAKPGLAAFAAAVK